MFCVWLPHRTQVSIDSDAQYPPDSAEPVSLTVVSLD